MIAAQKEKAKMSDTRINPTENCMLSIIIPMHNEEAYIEEALSSIFKRNKHFSNYEILLVDDASTDNSVSIVLDKYGNNKHLHLLSGGGKGVSHARNLALSHAKGKYIVFCDADDRFASGAFHHLVNRAEESNADLVIGRMKTFGILGFTTVEAADILANRIEDIPKTDPLLYRTMMITAKLYRREMLCASHIRFNNLAYAEDAVFFMKSVFASNRIVGCRPRNADSAPIIYEYRKRCFLESRSVTQQHSTCLWKDFTTSNKLILQLMEENIPSDRLQNYTEGFIQRTCENIVRAFWRNYWLCTSQVKDEMSETLACCREKVSPSLWEAAVCPKSEDHYLGLMEKAPFHPHMIRGQTTCYGIAVLISNAIDKKHLNTIFDSLYQQDFPSFCVIMSFEQAKALSAQYLKMENLYILDFAITNNSELRKVFEQLSINADYILPMNYPMGIHGKALSKLVHQLEEYPEFDVIYANVRDISLKKFSYRLRNRLYKYAPQKARNYLQFFDYADSLWKRDAYIQASKYTGNTLKSMQSNNAVFIDIK